MATAQKFKTILSPDTDAMLDKLNDDDQTALIGWLDATLPNIVRRTAITKSNTPSGTVFVFQVPDTKVIVTTVNGHDQSGARVMLVVGVGVVA